MIAVARCCRRWLHTVSDLHNCSLSYFFFIDCVELKKKQFLVKKINHAERPVRTQ